MLLQQHGFAMSVTRNLPLVTVCLLSHVFKKKMTPSENQLVFEYLHVYIYLVCGTEPGTLVISHARRDNSSGQFVPPFLTIPAVTPQRYYRFLE